MKLLQKFCLFSVIFLFAFLLFGIIQQTNAVPPDCRYYHPTRTKIRNVIIDNNISGYNIVISNGTTIIIEEAQSSIRDIGGDINVYLIPDYFDNDDFIDKCSGWECSTPTDTPNVDLWQVKPNDNFDFEKYKIGTISSGKFQDEVDFHEVRSWHDSFCARSSIMTQIITYHYKIEQIGNNYELIENNYKLIENKGSKISLYGIFLYSKAKGYKYYTIGSIIEILIFLFFGIKSINKNNKIQNKKLRLILGTLGFIIIYITELTVRSNTYFLTSNLDILIAILFLNSLINTLIFKYTLSIKRKYAIIFGILCSSIGISFLLLPLLQ